MTKPLQDSTRQTIAGIALRILDAEGVERVTMRRVAKEMDITPMALYYHYQDRKALLTAITAAEFDRVVQCMQLRLRRHPADSPLCQMMLGYLDYALASPNIFRYIFSEPRDDARRFPEDFRARKSPSLTLIADTLTEAMQTGKIRQDDPWELAMQLWSLAHGYAMLYLAGRFSLSRPRFYALVDRALRRFLDGLQA